MAAADTYFSIGASSVMDVISIIGSSSQFYD